MQHDRVICQPPHADRLQLLRAAVNHHNTDNSHVHLTIGGVNRNLSTSSLSDPPVLLKECAMWMTSAVHPGRDRQTRYAGFVVVFCI